MDHGILLCAVSSMSSMTKMLKRLGPGHGSDTTTQQSLLGYHDLKQSRSVKHRR